MSDTPQPIVICAQQRSGTTVLQRNLGQSPLATNYSEVFHNLKEISDVNYLLYRVEQFKENPQLSFPTEENQKLLFDRYVESLAKTCETPFYVMDIKYNSWHHFDSIWHEQFNRPTLIGFVRSMEMPVIHVIRKDVFRQHVSNKFAHQTQTWHYQSIENETPKEIAIRLDPTHCQYSMEMSQRRTKQFRSWFHGHNRYLELTYEEMFDNGVFSAQTLSAINELVGIDLQIPMKPALKKVLGSVSQVI
ncbi:Stf0 family sulfotransferase, partial [Planctomycetota bacterium]